ncbi:MULTISPECIES: hypothetical protein [unclassified Burkholderia]|uniref:hypothetical protein n=1 Tax=unclassified Burkholderia TaxID=2613784 RepID=UPI000F57C022|nr:MULTISPECIES: hypothetical protein [unclassified Burkholderia]RQR40897.1 hypothetical protein DIE20_19845 [Burkholderia sp. Bp9131]RQR69994.1 hypothetical protein DIE12_22420 [Burkholderia sp. Bp9015]RQS28775.1 hypothetical protein DIE05_15245 [Burkholderia sp. Bp8995]RQS30220.1 hypothetical protein DIE03_15370 [Burkholderia sp. Bp8992]RQS47141.1 hypothetical protein DIE00_15795 [Burkholderia sp. Bp8989]
MDHPLYKLLKKLDEKRLYYSLSRHRSDTILVSVTLVGMRVEVDVFDDGRMDVSCFRGDESVEGFEDLAYALIAEYGD